MEGFKPVICEKIEFDNPEKNEVLSFLQHLYNQKLDR